MNTYPQHSCFACPRFAGASTTPSFVFTMHEQRPGVHGALRRSVVTRQTARGPLPTRRPSAHGFLEAPDALPAGAQRFNAPFLPIALYPFGHFPLVYRDFFEPVLNCATGAFRSFNILTHNRLFPFLDFTVRRRNPLRHFPDFDGACTQNLLTPMVRCTEPLGHFAGFEIAARFP